MTEKVSKWGWDQWARAVSSNIPPGGLPLIFSAPDPLVGTTVSKRRDKGLAYE